METTKEWFSEILKLNLLPFIFAEANQKMFLTFEVFIYPKSDSSSLTLTAFTLPNHQENFISHRKNKTIYHIRNRQKYT